MKKAILAFLMTAIATVAVAQESWKSKEFSSFESYEAFVNRNIKGRDFEDLLRRLGGEAVYSEVQIEKLVTQMLTALPKDFVHSAVLKRADLDAGFTQEIRVFWNDSKNYIYYYGFVHQTEAGMQVLRFDLHTDPLVIFDRL